MSIRAVVRSATCVVLLAVAVGCGASEERLTKVDHLVGSYDVEESAGAPPKADHIRRSFDWRLDLRDDGTFTAHNGLFMLAEPGRPARGSWAVWRGEEGDVLHLTDETPSPARDNYRLVMLHVDPDGELVLRRGEHLWRLRRQ